jgi:hypothetical protein
MIIINQNYGQLCNQLFLYAHLIAYCINEKRSLWYPGFSENLEYFPNLAREVKNCGLFGNRFPEWLNAKAYSFFRRFFYSNSKLTRSIEYLLNRRIVFKMDALQEFCYPDRNGEKLPMGVCFFEGWAFRLHETWNNHHKRLKKLFEFSEDLRSHARTVIKRSGEEINIGIHIRRGDYLDMCSQWVYPMDYWINLMKELRQESGGRASFWVVSDDLNVDFKEDWITRYRGDRFEDLAVLAECDMIAGPPSTFNRWAAFVGGKPHCCIWSADNVPHVRDFSTFKLCSELKLNLSEHDLETIRWCGIA